MSPLKKSDGRRRMRHTHITGRHGEASSSQPAPPTDRARPRKRAVVRTAHERDLIDLLAHVRERDQRLIDAMAVIVTRGDAKVLAAVGTVVEFAIRKLPRARR